LSLDPSPGASTKGNSKQDQQQEEAEAPVSTRGFIGFIVDGDAKITYNHSDSYPDWLGVHMLAWLRDATKDPAGLRRQAQALRVVSPDSKPTAADIARFGEFSWGKDQHGGTADLREGQEWYDLLCETQGDPALILACGVIEDGSGFPADSLFAKWGYVVDLDGDGAFEVYQGFQKSPHNAGRFASMTPDPPGYPGAGQYYPVRLIASWPLGALPTDDEIRALERGEEDE
jgi:hypothetical protein